MSVVRVGVGCFVCSEEHPGAVLLGRRKGSHGAGMWALPGGHLEMGESWEQCASREVLEETNLTLQGVSFSGVTNDVAIGGNQDKHYVTIFMRGEAKVAEDMQNLEPHKCEEWVWVQWTEVIRMAEREEKMMFDPLLSYLKHYPCPI